jgi:hypothetical protein
MNIWQFPFLLLASRIFIDKRMESVVRRKLSVTANILVVLCQNVLSCVDNYVLAM